MRQYKLCNRLPQTSVKTTTSEQSRIKSFYVDNCLAGADSPQEAIKLQQQLRELLLQGGFDLSKWRSSSSEVMQAIPEDLHEPSQLKSIADNSTVQPQKALFMHWDTFKDCLFIASICRPLPNVACSRTRTFDALGWLSPATILMKILFNIYGSSNWNGMKKSHTTFSKSTCSGGINSHFSKTFTSTDATSGLETPS